MAATLLTVNNLVRSLLGDDEAAVYTDGMLLNFSNTAQREVQRKLVNRGVRALVTRAVINLTATQTQLSSASTPALPSDFHLGYRMWEKITGYQDYTYVPMTAVSELQDRLQSTQLGEWQYENGAINFVGATGLVTIRLEYERIATDFVNTTDPVQILNSEDAIAHLAAALAAGSRGDRGMQESLEAKAQDSIRDLAERHVRANQVITGVRRNAYGRWSN